MKGMPIPIKNDKQPCGVCDCGICFTGELIMIYPLIIKCRVCKKDVQTNGIGVIQ